MSSIFCNILRIILRKSKMSIGQQLKALRKKHKLSQNKFAEIFDIPFRTYWAYETDTNQIPASLVSKICNYFKVDANKVLEIENKVKPISRRVPDELFTYRIKSVGERLDKIRKFLGYSTQKMSKTLDISEKRYLEILTKGDLSQKEQNAIMNNFEGFTLDELLYDCNNTFQNHLIEEESDSFPIDIEKLSPEQKLKLKDFLKDL